MMNDAAPAGRERRRFARVALQAQVQVKVESTGRLFESRIRDLSENGVFIIADGTRPIGTDIRIHLVVEKEGVEFRAQGIVVHEVPPGDPSGRPAGVGVMFTLVEEDDADAIRALMKKGQAI